MSVSIAAIVYLHGMVYIGLALFNSSLALYTHSKLKIGIGIVFVLGLVFAGFWFYFSPCSLWIWYPIVLGVDAIAGWQITIYGYRIFFPAPKGVQKNFVAEWSYPIDASKERRLILRKHRLAPMMFPQFNELYQFRLKELRLSFSNLPKAWDGLTSLHMSDFHFGRGVPPHFFDWVLQKVTAYPYDMVLLTGDYLTHSDDYTTFKQWVLQVSAPLGVYGCLGNHDAMALKDSPQDLFFHDLGTCFTLLRDKCVLLPSEAEPSLSIIGLNYRFWLKDSRTIKDLLEQTAGTFRILLNHIPDGFVGIKRYPIPLMLSGHTHGGQIRMPGYGSIVVPSLYYKRYDQGVFRRSNEQTLVVNSGIGSSFPLRYQCPPEVIRIILERKP